MHKILILLAIVTAFLHASYNPFFSSQRAPAQKKVYEKVVIQQAPKPELPRKEVKLEYFGFIETDNGKFALIRFDSRAIIVRLNDKLYSGDYVYSISKIESNYIYIKDKQKRIQKIYFTSESTQQARL